MGAAASARDRALKAFQPVRSAAGPVRDADVQLELLAGLVGAGKGDGLGAEVRSVGAQLRKRRKAAGLELTTVLEGSEERITRRLSLLRAEVAGLEWKSVLKDARVIERRAARNMDEHDAESLHGYRKGAKFARYLAEMEVGSAVAARFARRVKAALDAIGRWHDWMLLRASARETLGKSATLVGVLEEMRKRSLRRAVRLVSELQ